MYRDLSEVRVGDRLTVNTSGRSPYEFTTAERVTKSFVVDAKGRKWAMSGALWGSGRDRGFRWGTTCRPFRPQDEQTNRDIIREQKTERMRNYLRNEVSWRTMDEKTLREVYRLVGGPEV